MDDRFWGSLTLLPRCDTGILLSLDSNPGTSVNAQTSPDEEPWTTDRLRRALEAYHVEHERICLDPEARNLRHTYVTPSEDKSRWRVQQMLIDPAGANDWVAEFDIGLAESRATGEPALQLLRLASLVA